MPTEPALEISELFYSIQGESTFAGLPCVFIRLTGCNLRCNYCDSAYTFTETGELLSIDKIIDFADQHPNAMVEITGGEPLLQQGVITLMTKLIARQRQVLLETNGSIELDHIPAEVTRIMDLKCPDSGMCDQMNFNNIKLLGKGDELKFVLSSRRDYDWAKSIIKEYDLAPDFKNTSPALLFSAVTGKLLNTDLADWILTDELPVRLQIQLHKIIWPLIERGV